MNKLCDKSKCTGCGACYNACSIGAISMEENFEGFLFPKIDEEKCVNCGQCSKSCPILTERKNSNSNSPKCYAVMADNNIRRVSSSGGAFSVMADYVLNNGGCVVGASYNEDWSVSHLIVDNKEDLSKLRGSKYYQSNIADIYKKIRKILNDKKQVLFSGTPCQVAGLYGYLQKDYDNLFTIELLCHGTPSYKIFKKYIEEENINLEDIKRVDFRDKVEKWNCINLTVELQNGEIIRKHITECAYEKGFHSGLFNRESCTPCHFAKLPRQADITIADWWGIGSIEPEMDDFKGTSMVLLNNEKGVMLFEETKEKYIKEKEISLKDAKKSVNKTIYKPLRMHEGRERFFKNLDKYSLEKCVQIGLKNKFDIGVLGLWAGNNYGCILTGYALYRLLENLGYSVAFVNEYIKNSAIYDAKTMVARFIKNVNTVILPTHKITSLNDYFDTFIVGSDQVFNYNLCLRHSKFFLLDFALSNKRKIAYASSYGTNFEIDKDLEESNIIKFLLNKFDKVSLRENYAPREMFLKTGIESIKVLDPVFVCGNQVYEELIEKSTVQTGTDYIFAYILDPNDEKNKVLKYVAETLNKKLYVVTDATNNSIKRNRINVGEVLDELSVEDWLKYYKNASYVVTDSFHGTCFSILFKKPFVSIGNLARGISRFYSLLDDFDLREHLFTSYEELVEKNLLGLQFNYDKVYQIIEKERNASLEWLISSLNIKKSQGFTEYDITRKMLSIFSNSKGYYYRNYRLNKFLYKITFGKLHKKYKQKMLYWKEKVREYKNCKRICI